jgi:hypothetical protein
VTPRQDRRATVKQPPAAMSGWPAHGRLSTWKYLYNIKTSLAPAAPAGRAPEATSFSIAGCRWRDESGTSLSQLVKMFLIDEDW